LQQLHNDVVVPLGVVAREQHTRLVDHGLERLVIHLQTETQLDLLHLALAA
jgi:hypothetical protein